MQLSKSRSNFRFKNKGTTGKNHGAELGQGDKNLSTEDPHLQRTKGKGNLWTEEYNNQSKKISPSTLLRLRPVLATTFPSPPSTRVPSPLTHDEKYQLQYNNLKRVFR